MVDRDEALRIAQDRLGRADVLLREFDDGWVGRTPPPPRPADPTALPEVLGSAAVVIGRDNGQVVMLPDVGLDRVIARYRREISVDDNYPVETQRHLRRFGWYPGRRDASSLERSVAQVNEVATRAGVPAPEPHELAVVVLQEFAGTALFPTGLPLLVFAPGRDRRDEPNLELWATIGRLLGRPVYGIGTWYDGLYHVVLADDGRVVLTGGDRTLLVGSDVPTAITALAGGLAGPVQVIETDGTVREDPEGFRP
jgi:hypothetical protein